MLSLIFNIMVEMCEHPSRYAVTIKLTPLYIFINTQGNKGQDNQSSSNNILFLFVGKTTLWTFIEFSSLS